MSTGIPDPVGDPEGYALWIEANCEECSLCQGSGEVPDPNDDDDITTCPRCNGSGHLDPIVEDFDE